MKSWEPPADLTRLLDALADEIIAATEWDVNLAGAASAVSRAMTPREMQQQMGRLREMIAMAIDHRESAGRPHIAEAVNWNEMRQRQH